MTRVWIGLGSNLDDPAAQIRRALRRLNDLPGTRLRRCSALYGSTPVGPADQPDFINAAAELDTDLAPEALLDALQALERDAGRRRTRHWGERTLDLDILLYGHKRIDSERLRVPHPEMTHRAFVLVPLAEAAPELRLPDGRPVAELARACNREGVWYHEACSSTESES